MRVRQGGRLSAFGLSKDGSIETPGIIPEPPADTEPVSHTLYPAQSSFEEGSSISVRWTAPPIRSPKDWIGVYVVGAPDSPSLKWGYVPQTGTVGTIVLPPVPAGGPYEARYFLDDGYQRVATSPPFQVTRVVAPPPPPPVRPPLTDIGGTVAAAKAAVIQMMAVLSREVGPIPLPPRPLADVIAWTKRAEEIAATNPEVAQAYNTIVALRPKESGGLFGAVNWVKEKVEDTIRLASVAVTFVAGDLPSPDDYEPENLCVTAWTNPAKFAILSAVAGLVFPPALLYLAAYVPPSPVGFTAGMAQAFLKGGGERVVTKILEPVGDSIAEILNTVIDFALNQDVALIRWALRKIASRLGDGVPKGIILALADAANSVVEAIKNLPALKSEGFYVDVGGSIERISDRFEGRLQGALRLAGAAIKAGGAAISIILNRGVEGLKEAKDVLIGGLLGIPGDFDALSQRAQTEIAKAKAPLIGTAGAIVQNLHQGITDLASAAENIPGNFRDLARTLLDLVGRLVGDARAFLERLIGLAATSEEPIPIEDTPGGGTPAPAPTPAPSPAGGGLSKILAIGAGGLLGAILGGPIGGVVGAGAGAALTKD